MELGRFLAGGWALESQEEIVIECWLHRQGDGWRANRLEARRGLVSRRGARTRVVAQKRARFRNSDLNPWFEWRAEAPLRVQ